MRRTLLTGLLHSPLLGCGQFGLEGIGLGEGFRTVAGVDSGFPLPLFHLGVGGVIMLPTTAEVHKGGRHCGACAVVAIGVLCHDGDAEASESCWE